jgi:hypothetical protein
MIVGSIDEETVPVQISVDHTYIMKLAKHFLTLRHVFYRGSCSLHSLQQGIDCSTVHGSNDL